MPCLFIKRDLALSIQEVSTQDRRAVIMGCFVKMSYQHSPNQNSNPKPNLSGPTVVHYNGMEGCSARHNTIDPSE